MKRSEEVLEGVFQQAASFAATKRRDTIHSQLDEREKGRRSSLPLGHVLCQLTPCRLIEIDDVVGVGIDARGVLTELREVYAMSLQEGIKVRLRSPVCIVDNTGAICAFVQCCPDVTRLIPYLFGEANPLIDKCLLLLRGRLKDVDQCDQSVLFGNTHKFLLLNPLLHER